MLPLQNIFFASAFCGLAGLSSASEITPEQRDFFETKIRPVLVKECYECHSSDSKKLGGKLRLDTPEGLKKGGESGSPVVVGQPANSLLIHALTWQDDLEMPPDNPLSENVVSDFELWISAGAPMPVDKEGKSEELTESGKRQYREEDLWSFQPLNKPEIPDSGGGWARTSIDHIVRAAMKKNCLEPTSDATAAVLIRRLCFDLTGLPPTVQEVGEFEIAFGKDSRVAIEHLVDRLLASPHFGERWGRHWLDVARYAESNGNDGLGRNASFPNAWRYRDYVIDSFNRDVPYDRFITEQIAGDLLPADGDAERDRQLVATGFLAIGSKPAVAMNSNFAMDVVADQIDAVGSGLIGLSVACARCHDHKFDPISTREYYALAGLFTSSETLYGIAANEKLTAPPTQLHVLKSSPRVPAPEKDLKLMIETEKLEMRNYPRPKKEHTYPPGTPVAMGLRDRKEPADCRINLKGDAKKLGEVVPRGVLKSAYPEELSVGIVIKKNQSGRLELAKWITNVNHPQTSRVMVNRIWQHLFGNAIVNTPDDFGVYGERPSHPELLDYLAFRFSRDHRWSVKSMIREIVMSRTYQLGSSASPESIRLDPENKWLSRHLRRRLDAESIRDAVLVASGKLNRSPAQGSSIRHLEILVNRAPDLHKKSDHRSVYLCYMRNSPPRELEAFDLPDGLKVAGKRGETLLPTQALFLLNSDFMKEQAGFLVEASGKDIRKLWRRVLMREPSETELAGAQYLLENTKPENQAWTSLAQSLLATNEFRYVD